MSTRKIPQPTFLHQPAAILDITHKYPFRMEIYTFMGGGIPRFRFFDGRHEEFSLYSLLSQREHDRFQDAIAAWIDRANRHDDPCPEMPHAAIRRVLDLLAKSIDEKVEEGRKQREEARIKYQAEHPEGIGGSVLEQLRNRPKRVVLS